MIRWQVLPVLILLVINLVASAIKHGEYKKDRQWNFYYAIVDVCIWLGLLWLMGVFDD